jgi:hypothetical protein
MPHISSGAGAVTVDSAPIYREPGVVPMTSQVVLVPDVDSDNRWRAWQARAAEGDRRLTTRMRKVIVLVAASLAAWLFVQLT